MVGLAESYIYFLSGLVGFMPPKELKLWKKSTWWMDVTRSQRD